MIRTISCFALVLLAGCAAQPVQPWQRAVLASPAMAWEMDPLLADYNDHIQVSKEAASGGASLGGGGCGCN
jgi:hypothetical protein